MQNFCSENNDQSKNYFQCQKLLKYILRTNFRKPQEFKKKFPHLNMQKVKDCWRERKKTRKKRNRWTQNQRIDLFYSFMRHQGKWADMSQDFPTRCSISIRQRFIGSFFNKNLKKKIIYFKMLLFEHAVINFGRWSDPRTSG